MIRAIVEFIFGPEIPRGNLTQDEYEEHEFLRTTGEWRVLSAIEQERYFKLETKRTAK